MLDQATRFVRHPARSIHGPTAAFADPKRMRASTRPHSRVAVMTLFLLLGSVMGSWAGRIPSVRGQIGLSDAQWGLIILASPVGTFITLMVVARIIPRTGARRLAIPGAIAVLCVVPVTATTDRVWALTVALLAQGMSSALLSTPMNTLAVEVERRYERPIMSSFHACFSLGQLGGGLAGVLAASVGIAPALQLTVTNTMLAGALLATVRWLPDDRPAAVEGRPAGTRGPRSAVGGPTGSAAGSVAPRGSGLRTLTPQLALLAGIALLTSINEGAAVQWSAQYGAVTLAAGAGIGALTFSCFSVAMTTSRLFGDRIVNRLGRARFLRFSALLAAAGMAVGLLVGTTTSAFVAFALLGAGSACIVPTVVGLAGNQPGIPAGRGVAAVSFGQWPAYLIGPPIIGAVAGLVGLRSALGVLVIAALAIAVLAGRVREPIAPDDPPLTIRP